MRLDWENPHDIEIWEMSYFKVKFLRVINHLGFIITSEGRNAQESVVFYPPKTFLTNQIHLENERNACVIH